MTKIPAGWWALLFQFENASGKVPGRFARIACLAAMLLGTLAGPSDSFAQALPDAGTLRQQIERDQAVPLPAKAEPLLQPAPAPLALPEGMTLAVHAWRIAGNSLLGDARLLPALADDVGPALGFADLQRAAQKVAQIYRDAGWIVRTYLPEQDVTEGTVTIQVVEAVFAGARVEPQDSDAPPPRIDPGKVVAIVDAQQPQGVPLGTAALDRGLLLADDLPGVSVSGALEPGEHDRETALALRLRATPLAAGVATLDNGGARSTGAARANFTAALASPLRLGDLWRLDAQKTQGTDYARLAASLPVGPQGLRVGLNASDLRYHLVGDDFAALDAKGSSTSMGFDLNYPLLRSRLRNVYLSYAYDSTRYRNDANGAVQSNYRIEAHTVALNGNAFDELGGGGANNASLALRSGELHQGNLEPGEDPSLAGHFNKLRYSVSRIQALTPRLALYGSLGGQYSGRKLDSSERFFLGGPDGVRAYPVNEGSGSRGQLGTAEIRYRAHETITVSGFFDAGHVSNIDSTTGNGGVTLKGAGAALAWSAPHGVDVRVTYAHRIGANPDPTASGADQDGSLVRNRVWLQASVAF